MSSPRSSPPRRSRCCARSTPASPRSPPATCAFELRHDWFEPGYGVVTPETTAAVDLAAVHHLKLETTYTGKAFAAMLGDARAGRTRSRRTRAVLGHLQLRADAAPGTDDALLPAVLREYVAECDRLFGGV